MKKLIFLFTVLLFISCESEDSADDSNNSSNSDNNVLVKTITTTTTYDGYGSDIVVEEYFYEGNKIERKVEYRSDDYTNINDVYRTYYYTYANNKISNVKRYDSDNDLEKEYVFNYGSNGNLVSYSEEWFYSSDYEDKSTYSFSYDGNYILYCDEEDEDFVKYTTNSNGDVTFGKPVQSCSFSAEDYTDDDGDYYTASIEYDSNPSPFKNIEGNNFMLSVDADIFSYAYFIGYFNNVTKITFNEGDEIDIEEWTYDYNSDNFPRNIQEVYEGDFSSTIDIEYY